VRIRPVLAHGTAALLLTLGCGDQPDAPPAASPAAAGADAEGHTSPTQSTIAANAAFAKQLPLADQQDFEDARRGLLLSDPDVVVPGPPGAAPIWDTRNYAFVDGDAPDSVNPSLWRQAKLNGIHGLFEVVDGLYQVRGYDLANMTVIRGDTGLILVDPLTAKETAAAAFALARRHLGDAPIVAVLFTHSHVDHFGGVAGVLPDAASQQGVRIIAPSDFVDEATSENVLAGIAMGRRATFMYGMPLARSPRGHVDTGLGIEPARGTIGILEPTEHITETGQELIVDGVRFVFQFAPHSEAPTEMTFFLPDKKAWCAAEIVNHTLHNIYTLRGAKVRDALLWSDYIDEALQRFGDAEVVFGSHHWPVFGNARARDLLTKQRDLYRFLNDQTLRLANLGLGPQEIAETLELPASLRDVFPNRDYYGTVRHDAKGIYQFYFGWYDGNPANLDPLPPVDASQRYVEAMGGVPEALRKGREAAERGDYRWAATLLNHVVFAQPENDAARETLAGVYDQLGYRAESGPWRDVYLTGALELRRGIQGGGPDLAAAAGLLGHLPAGRFFDSLATRVDPSKTDGKQSTVNFVFTDVGETHVVTLENSVLHHWQRAADPGAVATVTLTRDFLVKLATGQAGLREMIFSDDLSVEGSRLELLSFFSNFDRNADGRFPIVTP
jgi:alkyl sulfatase BDS1-like metallo-beta-lactamase superfamily hydrolase